MNEKQKPVTNLFAHKKSRKTCRLPAFSFNFELYTLQKEKLFVNKGFFWTFDCYIFEFCAWSVSYAETFYTDFW